MIERIQYLNLQRQYSVFENDIEEEVLAVLRSTQYVMGRRVSSFETSFAKCHDSIYCCAVNSGTSALHVALLSLGIGPGDEVILPAMTFAATIASVLYTGATPVLVDVDRSLGTIKTDLVEQCLTPKTKAIIPVHLYGNPCRMDQLVKICTQTNIALIEDAAQAHLAEFENRPVGSFGAIGCFSFYPGKNLGAVGESGAIITNSSDLNQRCRLLRDWGSKEKYDHQVLGYNYRMDEIQAAALSVKLRVLSEFTDKRIEIANKYTSSINNKLLRTPPILSNCKQVFHTYSIFLEDASHRSRFLCHMDESEISCGLHYPKALHQQQAFSQLARTPSSLHISEEIASSQVSLPIDPLMTPAEIDRVIDACNRFF